MAEKKEDLTTQHLEAAANPPSTEKNDTHDDDDPKWIVAADEFANVDKVKMLRKMDLRLIPMLAVLYLLSFLDRGNIGNAKILGLQTDLHLTGNQYNICATVFFFPYCFFEVPSNLLLKKFKPSIWLPSIMVAWGVVMTLMGLVQNYHGLLIARIFLGLAEAGLYPGVAYYLTMWYETDEMAFRQGLFFSAASLAGAFSGLLAFAINQMNGVAGLAGWRWIFILEGILTVVVAVASYFLIYDYPTTASFLTEDEKAWAYHRLKYQACKNTGRMYAESDTFEWKYVIQALTDWQLYVNLFVYWGVVGPLYGISFFLPTIINQLGFSSTTAQLLTIPIYATAAVVAVFVCWLSDRAAKAGRSRWPYVFGSLAACLIGYVLAIAGSAGNVPGVVYAGVFIATCGLYPGFPGNVAWISNNLAGSYKRAAGMAFSTTFGNMAGAMASNFYRSQDSPKFLLGHGMEIMLVSFGLVAVLVSRSQYIRINRQRDADADTAHVHLTDTELSELGDRSPTFRYKL